MDSTSKTLYIPLRGKAEVSRKGLILHDPQAEAIWLREGFPLKGRAASPYLAYSMAMRAAVIDQWVQEQLLAAPQALVLHLGCGLDARVQRVKAPRSHWVDVDLPPVMQLRRQYFQPTPHYTMLDADVGNPAFLSRLPHTKQALVVMEGLSMYLAKPALRELFSALGRRFPHTGLIMDAYSSLAVKASRFANPIRAVGARAITGLDNPRELEGPGIFFQQELSMAPEALLQCLPGRQQWIFRHLYAGRSARRLYRLFTYQIS